MKPISATSGNILLPKRKRKRMIQDSPDDVEHHINERSQQDETQNKLKQIRLSQPKKKGRPKYNINSEANIRHFNIQRTKRKRQEDDQDLSMTEVTQEDKVETELRDKREVSKITSWLIRKSAKIK